MFAELFRVERTKKTIEISKEFRDSKRNLLWACSFSILLAFANLSAPYEVAAPLVSGLKIHAGALVLLVSVYVTYLWLRFRYEGLKVTRENCATKIDQEDDDRPALDSILKAAGDVRHQLIEWQSRVNAVTFSKPQDHKSAVIRNIKEAQGHLSEVKPKYDQLIRFLFEDKNRPKENVVTRQQMEGFAETHAVEANGLLEHALESIEQSAREIEDTNDEVKALNNSHLDALEAAVDRVRLDIESYYRFSQEIDASDTRMFALHDWIIPHLISIFAVIGPLVIHFRALIDLG